MILAAKNDVGISVGYGLGATCEGSFERESLNGASVRNVIRQVVSTPQSSPESTRTAVVLQDVLRGGRLLDVELAFDPADAVKPGKPVSLEDALLGGGKAVIGDQDPKNISLRVSEPYRGGSSS